MTSWGPLAIWGQARRTCAPHCFGYHATWPLARAAGLKASPRWHADYYRDQLTDFELPEDGQLRVLVAGAADHTVLQVLAELLGSIRLVVVVVDRCATPLEICRRWAHHHGVDLDTEQLDLQDLQVPAQPFDVAVCDGLLSLLPDETARHDVLARVAAALRGDGLLIYTTRLSRQGRPLDYDLIGRSLQTVATFTGPGPVTERLRLAGQRWRRPARSAPYRDSFQLETELQAHFAKVDVATDSRPPTRALQLHPARLAGTASTVLRATAIHPSRGKP